MPAADLPAYPPANEGEQARLLEFAANAPLVFGPWRDLKGLYKLAEADPNAAPALLGALIARFDAAALVANPTAPTADLGNVGNMAGFAVRDGLGCVLYGQYIYPNASSQLGLYDLTTGQDPLKPRRIGAIGVGLVHRIAFCGPYLVTLSDFQERPAEAGMLCIYDVSNPAAPRLRGQLATQGNGPIGLWRDHVGVCVSGKTGTFSGLRILSLRDPDHPASVGVVNLQGAAGVVVSDDGRLAAVAISGHGFQWTSLPKPGGVRLVDIDDPAHPRIIGEFDANGILSGSFADKLLLLGVGNDGRIFEQSGIRIFDISDPRRPREVGHWRSPGYYGITAVHVRGDYAYVCEKFGVVYVLDLRDPGTPVAVGTINTKYALGVLSLSDDLAYVPTQHGGLQVWNLANPAKPVRFGTPPSAETIGYMKRRARRFLRRRAATDPTRYVSMAYETLSRMGGGDGAGLDLARNWVAADILYGGGNRLGQAHHGRGTVYALPEPGGRRWLRLRTREERAPAVWDARPDLLASLLTMANLPWQVHEMAARALRAQRHPLPHVTDPGMLRRWLGGGSPLLVPLAVRAVVGRLVEPGIRFDPAVAALTYFASGGAPRHALRSTLPADAPAAWSATFAGTLAARVAEAGRQADGGFTRRALAAVSLIAARFPDRLAAEAALPLLAPLVRSGRDDLLGLAVACARRVNVNGLPGWVDALLPLSEREREPVVTALEQAMAGAAIDNRMATDLVLLGDNADRHRLGWRLIAASATPQPTLAALWTTLLDQTHETPALRSAMTSPHALALLTRAGITTEQITERLSTRPFLVALLSAETFTRLTQTMDALSILRLIAGVPDERWDDAKAGWLRNLREGVGLLDLWSSLPAALREDRDGRIEARTLGDADVAETLFGLDAEHVGVVLALREPSADMLVWRWVERHADAFGRDSDVLLGAATHPLPRLRGWGLERVAALGMGLPFALRLLESEVPPSAAAGRGFFEAVPPGGDREMTYALALCDSPAKSVRRFGRTFVTARWATLPRANLYRALFENPDPETQAFVAALLNDEPPATRPEETAQFDRDVLRSRNRARKAKEAVKARQAFDPTIDVETLLALARGSGTPRDAEWALGQLARRALSGEKIEGFAVEGVAGV